MVLINEWLPNPYGSDVGNSPSQFINRLIGNSDILILLAANSLILTALITFILKK